MSSVMMANENKASVYTTIRDRLRMRPFDREVENAKFELELAERAERFWAESEAKVRAERPESHSFIRSMKHKRKRYAADVVYWKGKLAEAIRQRDNFKNML